MGVGINYNDNKSSFVMFKCVNAAIWAPNMQQMLEIGNLCAPLIASTHVG